VRVRWEPPFDRRSRTAVLGYLSLVSTFVGKTSEVANGGPRVRAVGRDEVRRLMAAGAQLVEVLPREDFDEEHLPGAENIPLAELGDRLDELDRSRPVVVYCFDGT